MLNTILMAAPILAFALPFAVTPPSSARPLATPVPEAEFCWGDCDDELIDLLICVEVQLVVNRDYECEVNQGPQCLTNCTPEAVTPLCLNQLGDRARSAGALTACQEERVGTCRSQCEAGGAAFCTEGARWDDGGGQGGTPVFIDIDVCVWLDA
ncbi:hypothetical protein [Nannocystis pusilla]|uniref:Uncharacterized protein n=1 Tax=Nannocystis pusilla TaxID=889268 RepID=A0ABS7U224_9BACT|nr:hypothetical protein [Nannocystis pusilla]MBZ5714499.1 hypothetical protein [Nannocystis pusilla]